MRTNLKNLTIVNPDYLACVMWKDQYGRTHRYMLWDEVGETRPLGFPLYSGQLIKKNFRIEIWSISGEDVTEAVGQNFITSVLQGIDYRYGSDGPLSNNDGQVLDFAAQGSAVTSFPVTLDPYLQARWLATNATDGIPWISSDPNAWSLVANGGPGFVTETNATIATNPVALIEGINLAGSLNITPGHIFIVLNIPVQGASVIYNFDSSTQYLNAIAGPGTSVTLTIEDGTTIDVPTNEWIIVEIGYSGGNSFMRYFSLSSRDAWSIPTMAPSSTTVSNRALLSILNYQNNFYVADIEIYVSYLDTNSYLIMDYLYNRYNYNFLLPLVFPSNSSPQPNNI